MLIRSQAKAAEETKRIKKLDIPSLNLDKLKQYSTNEPVAGQNLLAKKEVLSERGGLGESFSKHQKSDLLYGNYKKGKEGVLSVDKHKEDKKFGFAMTGRLPMRNGNMFGGTSVNRNYQSTGRTLSNREGNLELYAHRKNQSKNDLNAGGASNQRRAWKEGEDKKNGSLLQRYNSIEGHKKNPLDNSLPPKEKNKRGLSILNRENNNFVRDVSERVKRTPLSRLKSIELYGDKGEKKKNEYEFEQVEKGREAIPKETRSKSGVLHDEAEPREKGKSSTKRKRTSIDQDFAEPEKKKKAKGDELKHIKRRNAKKKKRDVSTKKKGEKDKKKEKNKKKHQPSLSTKIDRNPEPARSKKSSIQELHEKKAKKKKTRKASESTSKMAKKRKRDAKGNKHADAKNLFVSGEVFVNSLYTGEEEPEKARKKKTKKAKHHLKSSKEGRKAKGFKLTKKGKDSPKDLSSKEQKRYLSVNAGKNPLLESDLLQNFNPRKTLNPKTISFKRGNSFKSNDIQKTDLFTYKFQRDAKKKAPEKNPLYGSGDPKGLQTALYQRNRSQASSDNDDMNQGLYKNLYSGRHEKNILEFNSNQSRAPNNPEENQRKKANQSKLPRGLASPK